MPRKIEFTDIQKHQISEFYKDGVSAKEIGKIIGVSNCTILRFIKNDLGIKIRKDPPKVGDVIKGWEVIDIYHNEKGRRIAKITNTNDGGDVIRNVRLTNLTKENIGESSTFYENGVPTNKLLTKRNTKHGKKKTRLYSIWRGMKNRCNNVKSKYGELGISVYEEWNDSFISFEKWALSNGYSDDLSIDRIDPFGNYCPDNCRWVSSLEQARNKTNSLKVRFTAFNEEKSIQEWFHDPRCFVPYATLIGRISAGWDGEKALTYKGNSKGKKKTTLKNWLKHKYPDIYNEYYEQ